MNDTSAEALRRERDLYLRLLDLGQTTSLDALLSDALSLVVEVAGARRGYLELRGDWDDTKDPMFWTAAGFSDAELDIVRAAVSTGIVAEALATGEVVETATAFLDPRFDAFESVRARQVQAVLCTSVGHDEPLGVLYLEGQDGIQHWPSEARKNAELVASYLGPFAERVLARELERPDETQGVRGAIEVSGIVGRSSALAAALEQARLVTPLEVNVLLTGETGTGKTQLARAIHENGRHAGKSFVEFNCAALQEQIAENELFGSVKGAFTGADGKSKGKVEAARGGTLFLDEIGEMAPAVQAKILQLIQSREFYPLGADQPIKADVRIIAATNMDLEQAVAEKRFRADLFYRLHVMSIRMPSLRERREDLAELAAHLLRQAIEAHQLPWVEFSPGALLALETADWPGNIRQLSHVIEAGAIRAGGTRADRVEKVHLFPDAAIGDPEPMTLQEATRGFQREAITKALKDADWNVTEAAKKLDVARSHLYNLIRGLEITRG